uniref:Uncharacterized protein n=1 Tax=Trypanosoma vivax (strain Y486) TaxID=1055687 RepID=G0UA79_TRYVY|nr:hypothetical protein, unlikely [Trypanosoma vivax Y486]
MHVTFSRNCGEISLRIRYVVNANVFPRRYNSCNKEYNSKHTLVERRIEGWQNGSKCVLSFRAPLFALCWFLPQRKPMESLVVVIVSRHFYSASCQHSRVGEHLPLDGEGARCR